MQNIEKPILSISLLVSNRIDSIRKCMESIRPLLTELSAELVVVDTVGEEQSDGSLAVVKEYTDNIVHFDWCSDFAAARNVGLKRCRGEWFLFLDDDEWFEDVSEIIAFFRSGEYKKYNSATYQRRNYKNKTGDYSISVLKRMIKFEKTTCFVGVVHEYLTPMYTPCKNLGSFMHHYGYVFDTEEEHLRHSERNLSLLRPEFEKNPWDMHVRVQMVQECMYLEHLQQEATALCEETLKADKKKWLLPEFQWILASYVRLANRNEEFETILERTEHLRSKYPLSAFSNLVISIMELHAAWKTGCFERGSKVVKQLCKAYDFLIQNPEQRQLQSVLDFDAFLEKSILIDALKAGVICCNKAGYTAEAKAALQRRTKLREKPVLTISLLVSNRIATIRKCLDSLQPLLLTSRSGFSMEDLAGFSAELIVVDTVGEEKSDGSLAIAKEYTDNIVHFDWCNDFAAARNAGLKQAQGEWFLYLDDDEWFESVNEILHFFTSGEYLEYNSATYQIRNYKDTEGRNYSTAVLGRMVRLRENTCFVGRIHETFSAIYIPCRDFSDYVHHYGYAYVNEEEKQMHIQRNIGLLREELKQNPQDLRIRTQMALELANFDNEAALAFCKETFYLCSEKKDAAAFQWQLSLVFCLYEALGTSYAEAEASYKELKNRFGFSETAENAICVQLTRICLLQKQNVKAHPYAERYFETLAYLSEHKEEAQYQMTADFARYQSRNMYLEMLDFAAFSAWQAREYETAWKHYTQMPWDEAGYENRDGLWKIFAMSEEAPRPELLYPIIQNCMKNETMKPVLGEMLKHPAVKQRVSLTLEAQKQKTKSAAVVQAEEEDLEWLALPLEEFMQKAEKLLATDNLLNEGVIWQKALDHLEKESMVKYMFLLYRMAETELLQTITAAENAIDGKYRIGELMESCVRTGRAFYEALYRPECFSEKGICWMPADCHYNDILVHFLDGGKKELSMLLDAAKLRPGQVPVIKAWLAELAKK